MPKGGYTLLATSTELDFKPGYMSLLTIFMFQELIICKDAWLAMVALIPRSYAGG